MLTKLIIDIQYASPAIEQALSKVASPTLVKKWIKAAVHCNGLLTLRFVNAAEGKKLNWSFRKKNYSTNVLTFPYEHSKNHINADIIFCMPVIRKEAHNQNKSLKQHLAHLIVHGCLHAQNYDHEKPSEAQKMERLEVKILKTLGFENPYLPL